MSAQMEFAQRAGHPYQVETLADLPVGLREPAEQALPADDPIRTIILIPQQLLPKRFGSRAGARRLPEQVLLFTTCGALHVLDKKSPNGKPQVTYLRGEDLLYLQLTIILLYGRLELSGVHAGSQVRMIVEYNTARHDLIQPGLQHLLHLASQPTTEAQPPSDKTGAFINELKKQSLKFSNALHDYALQPDEHLAGYIYQPRLRKDIWRIFHRLLAPACILALTDRNMIMVAEGRSSATSYGWFFTFCPRRNITHCDTQSNDEVQVVNVHLAMESVTATCAAELDADRAQAWQALTSASLN